MTSVRKFNFKINFGQIEIKQHLSGENRYSLEVLWKNLRLDYRTSSTETPKELIKRMKVRRLETWEKTRSFMPKWSRRLWFGYTNKKAQYNLPPVENPFLFWPISENPNPDHEEATISAKMISTMR